MSQPWRLRNCTHLESVFISAESLVPAPRSLAQSFGHGVFSSSGVWTQEGWVSVRISGKELLQRQACH